MKIFCMLCFLVCTQNLLKIYITVNRKMRKCSKKPQQSCGYQTDISNEDQTAGPSTVEDKDDTMSLSSPPHA